VGFAPWATKPAEVLHLIPTGPQVYPPLDTIGVMFYGAFFIALTLLTMRRPAYGACVLAIVVPFALYQRMAIETLTLPKAGVLAVLLGLSAHPNAFAPIAMRAPWRILTAGLLVLGATLLSFVHAAYTVPVIQESLKIVEYVLTFCAVVAAYRLDPDRRAVASALGVTGLVVALLALAEEVVGSPSVLLVNGHVLPRIAGPIEGPNQLAGYFDVAIPVALAFTLRECVPPMRVALFAMIFADILTFSRGGLIGAAAGIITIAFVYRGNVRAAMLPIVAGIAAGIGLIGAFAAHVHSFAMLRVWNWESNYAGGVGTRPELWRAAIALWKRYPLFGVGAGNFELELAQAGVYGVRTHANSLYLQALAEGGIPLIVATLWLVYVSIDTFVRERLESPFVAAALAGSIALALHQGVDLLTFYPKVGGEWWIVMALAAAEVTAVARVQQAACA
jgi:O-antigen ligase